MSGTDFEVVMTTDISLDKIEVTPGQAVMVDGTPVACVVLGLTPGNGQQQWKYRLGDPDELTELTRRECFELARILMAAAEGLPA